MTSNPGRDTQRRWQPVAIAHGRFPWREFHRHTGLAVLVFLAAIGLAACNGQRGHVDEVPGVSPEQITLGSSSALGGHAGFLGTQYTRGALTWFNEVNANGGIHGRKIALTSYDDQYDPPKTIANTEKLIHQDKVFMLFNYVGTPTSVKIIDIVHEAKIPSFGFFTGAEALRTPFRPYMFHVRASYYSEAEGAVAYFVDKLGYDKIAVMYQNDAFGLAVLTGVQLALWRRDLEIASTDTYERGTLDVERAIKTIQQSGAQAVIMVGTYSPLAKSIKRCNERGFHPYFHTVSFVGSEAFAAELVIRKVDPAQYEKIIVTQVVPSPFSEEHQAVREYQRLTGKHFPDDPLNYVALEGFINAKILTQVLNKAGRGLTRERIIRILEETRDLDVGIGKKVSFGSLDHKGLDGIYYSRLDGDGVFRIFAP